MVSGLKLNQNYGKLTPSSLLSHPECAADRTLPCLRNGTEVLQKYSFRYSEDTVLIDYLFCFLWCLVFHVIGYLGLKRVVKKEGFY